MIHFCSFLVTHMMLKMKLIIRVIHDVNPSDKIEGTVFDLNINGG